MFSVCVFLVLWMLCFFLWRDVFESLICWLDPCLSSLLVAFISLCFSSLWKTHFLQARQLLDRSSTNSFLLSLFFFFSWQKLTHSWSIKLSRLCLDRCSTASLIYRATFYLVDRFSSTSWSIEVFLLLTNNRQHLDKFISVKI